MVKNEESQERRRVRVRKFRKLIIFRRRPVSKQIPVALTENSSASEVKKYLKEMTMSVFCGDRQNEKSEENLQLGKLLKKLYLLLEAGKAFSVEARVTLDKVIDVRTSEKSNETERRLEMQKDYQKFLEIREKTNSLVEECKNRSDRLKPVVALNHDEFWGSRQQLRSGKVIADMLGGLDPVFGSLLNPTGGRIGRGDSEILHNLLYKQDDAMSYHAAVHDAFGYLIQYHKKGPGYNYLCTKWTFYRKESPMSCQAAGVKFWKRVLKKVVGGQVF